MTQMRYAYLEKCCVMVSKTFPGTIVYDFPFLPRLVGVKHKILTRQVLRQQLLIPVVMEWLHLYRRMQDAAWEQAVSWIVIDYLLLLYLVYRLKIKQMNKSIKRGPCFSCSEQISLLCSGLSLWCFFIFMVWGGIIKIRERERWLDYRNVVELRQIIYKQIPSL